MTAIDLSLLDFIQTHLRSGIGDILMPLITRLGDSGIVWIILTLVLLCNKKYRVVGFCVAFALAIDVTLVNVIIKPLVARIRPYEINTAVALLITKPNDFSFPSGHAAVSFAAVSALYFQRSKLWIPAMVLSILIAYSRLYLYVHYPSDVVAGIILGIFAGILAQLAVKSVLPKYGRTLGL